MPAQRMVAGGDQREPILRPQAEGQAKRSREQPDPGNRAAGSGDAPKNKRKIFLSAVGAAMGHKTGHNKDATEDHPDAGKYQRVRDEGGHAPTETEAYPVAGDQ